MVKTNGPNGSIITDLVCLGIGQGVFYTLRGEIVPPTFVQHPLAFSTVNFPNSSQGV